MGLGSAWPSSPMGSQALPLWDLAWARGAAEHGERERLTAFSSSQGPQATCPSMLHTHGAFYSRRALGSLSQGCCMEAEGTKWQAGT